MLFQSSWSNIDVFVFCDCVLFVGKDLKIVEFSTKVGQGVRRWLQDFLVYTTILLVQMHTFYTYTLLLTRG